MRYALFIFCALQWGCAHRYALSLGSGKALECERVSLMGDTVLCDAGGRVTQVPFDSLREVKRAPRLGGTLLFGGLGAATVFFVGTIFGALWAWSNQSQSPEPLVLIPAIAGGALGFLGGKAIWELIDRKSLDLMRVPPEQRKQRFENFVKK